MKISFFCKLLVTMAVLSLDHFAYPLKLSAADECAVDLKDVEQMQLSETESQSEQSLERLQNMAKNVFNELFGY